MTNDENLKSYFEEFYDYVEWYFNIHYEAWGYFRVRWYFYDDYGACKIEPVVYWGA